MIHRIREFRLSTVAAVALVMLLALSVAGSRMSFAQGVGDPIPDSDVSHRETLVTLTGEVRKLGSKEIAASHVMYALFKGEISDDWVRERFTTDEAGRYSIRVPRQGRVRLYSSGRWIVSAGWSSVMMATEERATQVHDVWLRQLDPVRLSGKLSRPGSSEVAGAQVVMAMLDELPDGSAVPLRSPYHINVANSGEWVAMVPAGLYDVWALWSDRDSRDWDKYYAQRRRIEVYQATAVDLTLAKQPRVSGDVVDASKENAPIEAEVELYTHGYLRQLKIFTGNTTLDGEETPEGSFDDQLSAIDPNDFVAVISTSEPRDTVLVVPGMSVEKLKQASPFRLRDPANGKLTISCVTKDKLVPLNVTMQVQPLKDVAAPSFVQRHLALKAKANEHGQIVLWGLPKGRYELFVSYDEFGDWKLGEIDVTGGVQQHVAAFDAPFAMGKLTYPDGTTCTNARAWVIMKREDGRERMFRVSAFENLGLKTQGKFYLPLFFANNACEVVFAAPEQGKEMQWNDTPDTLPFVGDSVHFDPIGKGAIEFDVKLKPRVVPAAGD